MRRGVRAGIACVVAGALAAPGGAAFGASSEAVGKYDCVETNKTLKLKGDGRYTYGGRGGKYDYRKRKKRVTFSSGPITDLYGIRVIDVNGGVDLYKKSNDKVKAHCIDASQQPEI